MSLKTDRLLASAHADNIEFKGQTTMEFRNVCKAVALLGLLAVSATSAAKGVDGPIHGYIDVHDAHTSTLTQPGLSSNGRDLGESGNGYIDALTLPPTNVSPAYAQSVISPDINHKLNAINAETHHHHGQAINSDIKHELNTINAEAQMELSPTGRSDILEQKEHHNSIVLEGDDYRYGHPSH